MKKSDHFQDATTSKGKARFGFFTKTLRTLVMPALAATLLAGAIAAPANAEQSLLSKILFGTTYNDHVTIVDAGHPINHWRRDLPLTAIYPSPALIKASQAEVNNSPALREALQKRNIRTFNVLWVQTAMNGGKIVYIK